MKDKAGYLQSIPVYALVILALLLVSFLGEKAVTVMADTGAQPARHCVIVDAGHGGVDGGATSCSGILESRLNLEIALRLKDLLHLLGYPTKMIRTEDISVYTEGTTISAKKISDLKERVRIVNGTECGILLSIHQNYFADAQYSGAQVFYGKNPQSEALAKAMQKAFVSTLNPGSNRQAKKASGIYLMEHIQCPGILLECGFLSNQAEEAQLRDPAYQKHICCVIAAVTASFLAS